VDIDRDPDTKLSDFFPDSDSKSKSGSALKSKKYVGRGGRGDADLRARDVNEVQIGLLPVL
jgi:hypothetical protein